MLQAMNGQYLCNRQITVSYAYKKDTKGERHGTPAGEFFTHPPPPFPLRPFSFFDGLFQIDWYVGFETFSFILIQRGFWLQAIQMSRRAGPIPCLQADLQHSPLVPRPMVL